MGLEIERKFLVDSIKWWNEDWIHKFHPQVIKQGYVTLGEILIRFRTVDNKGVVGYKQTREDNLLSRKEFEQEISNKDAEHCLENFCHSKIEKRRYRIFQCEKWWEVDVFDGENSGLIIAEIELESEDEKFEIPWFAKKEVTGDKRYYNEYLVINPFKKWKVVT